MNRYLKYFLFSFIINIIYSEPIWNITFFDEDDSYHKNPNIFNLTKGNYKTIKIVLEYIGNDEEKI